ncbi:MAG: helix-turn-helix domain-containing protein [Caulobacteraceae bacterium]
MKRLLLSDPVHAVSVCRYAPGERHATHRDSTSRISVVLRGGFDEDVAGGVARLGPGDVLLKSRDVAHEDAFGAAGATVLSLEFAADDPFEGHAQRWGHAQGAQVQRLAASLLEAAVAGDANGVAAAGGDLLTGGPSKAALRHPPAWLRRLRDELEAAGLAGTDIAARAREAGVHAAHASRLFRRCFGVSMTEHAQAHAVRRAMALLQAPEAALGDVAAAAGFYDQSHMTRVFRRVTGRAPGARRALSQGLSALAG